MPAREYVLARTKRRTLALTVQADGSLLVRAPLLLPSRAIDAFVASKADWIARRRQTLLLRPAHTYTSGDAFPYFGELLPLVLSDQVRTLLLTDGRLLAPQEAPEKVRERLLRFYRAEAKAVFASRVAHFAPIVGVTSGPVRVSGAETRYGSCGKNDSINLNWRLLLAPPDVLDYVVLHELCHIGQRDHSKAFWARVARVCPDWKEKRKWLSEHHAALSV